MSDAGELFAFVVAGLPVVAFVAALAIGIVRARRQQIADRYLQSLSNERRRRWARVLRGSVR